MISMTKASMTRPPPSPEVKRSSLCDATNEAMLYEKLAARRVRCSLCEHRCLIEDGKRGMCQARENRHGTLYTLVYGRAVSHDADPIEKKPLFHFYPGSSSYSVATAGCNFHCRWCHTWSMSQALHERRFDMGTRLDPTQIVDAALQARCQSIAFTCTEPTIFFEYAYDTACLGHEAGLTNIVVTNGYMSTDALDAVRVHLDAASVDLKAFRDETYQQYVGGRLQPVLNVLKAIVRLGIWLEVTTLVIPGVNDDPAELKDIATFVASELGAQTPWHISRFFPGYKMVNIPPTPVETLERAREIGGAAGLRYVYVGNTSDENNTYCHYCGQLLVRRYGYGLVDNKTQPAGCCPNCGTRAAGRWAEDGLGRKGADSFVAAASPMGAVPCDKGP